MLLQRQAGGTVGFAPGRTEEFREEFQDLVTLRVADTGHGLVTGLEARAGEMAREVHMKPGEEWTQQKYVEMNERYFRQTIEQLERLAAMLGDWQRVYNAFVDQAGKTADPAVVADPEADLKQLMRA